MINIIHFPATNSVEVTWLGADGKQVRCHSYADVQMAMMVADLGDTAAEYAELIANVTAGIQPQPVLPAAPKQFTSLDYLDLFTEEEQIAVVSATMVIPQIKLWYDKMLAAGYVTIADPRTKAGLSALVQANLLTADRKLIILSQMQ